MTARLFVLDVPEFASLVAAGAASGLQVERREGYAQLAAPDAIRLDRAATGLGRAVWYGALTGGYLGSIERFDDEALVIRAAS
jgi:hypothetical protein